METSVFINSLHLLFKWFQVLYQVPPREIPQQEVTTAGQGGLCVPANVLLLNNSQLQTF